MLWHSIAVESGMKFSQVLCLVIVAVGGLIGSSITQAKADWHDGGWHRHWYRPWWGWGPAYFYRPPVYYVPPPVVYAPPPPVYYAPGVSFGITIR
jgi:hypothetical protein